jgi:polyhydroxyalkanoate synthesis regulator phasin
MDEALQFFRDDMKRQIEAQRINTPAVFSLEIAEQVKKNEDNISKLLTKINDLEKQVAELKKTS